MHEMKDTARATVRIGFDGRVHKIFRGHMARERFEHEVRVLRYLQRRDDSPVPGIEPGDGGIVAALFFSMERAGVQIVLTTLVGNAVRYTSSRSAAR